MVSKQHVRPTSSGVHRRLVYTRRQLESAIASAGGVGGSEATSRFTLTTEHAMKAYFTLMTELEEDDFATASEVRAGVWHEGLN